MIVSFSAVTLGSTWRQFHVSDSGGVPLSKEQRLLIRSIEVRAVDGATADCRLANAGIIFLAVSIWVLGSRMGVGCKLLSIPEISYDDSHSVQAGCSGVGFSERLDIHS